MKIRGFRLDDLDRVYEIELNSFSNPYDKLILKDLFNIGMCFLVATIDDFVVGYILFGLKTIDTGHIMSIAVDKDYMNMGVGTKLLIKSLEYYVIFNVFKVKLEVRSTNYKAINFYKKMGFIETNFVHSFYEDGCDGIKMSLDIDVEKVKGKE
ncbi:MAG: ribosomal protein S18-alanine N-acetyltransferase [Methanobrevibacter sp.]|jgi:ribosomal-protein-alanine N-acetyltransferase|nr:ribosomal protein S18-alanine N-acetyltransferase [Candidatus Methanoflexus mossambicus]